MKEFACRSIGVDCSWKHEARTEELLADVAALHLRDVHGMRALGADTVARIKQTFSEPSPVDERTGSEEPVLKEFRCSDLGQNCSWHFIAQTEELIVDGVAVHARDAHGIREFTQEMKVSVENALRPWKG
jgi:predicted small metal-binding protein